MVFKNPYKISLKTNRENSCWNAYQVLGQSFLTKKKKRLLGIQKLSTDTRRSKKKKQSTVQGEISSIDHEQFLRNMCSSDWIIWLGFPQQSFLIYIQGMGQYKWMGAVHQVFSAQALKGFEGYHQALSWAWKHTGSQCHLHRIGVELNSVLSWNSLNFTQYEVWKILRW